MGLQIFLLYQAHKGGKVPKGSDEPPVESQIALFGWRYGTHSPRPGSLLPIITCKVGLCLKGVPFSGPAHTTPEEFENGVLFLQLGLPSTLIRHENGAFRKRSSNRRNLKKLALRFSVDRKHFENETSRKRWRHENHDIP